MIKSGFMGKDIMREKAHNMLKHDISDSNRRYPPRISKSAPGLMKERLYKDGGDCMHIPKELKHSRLRKGGRIKRHEHEHEHNYGHGHHHERHHGHHEEHEHDHRHGLHHGHHEEHEYHAKRGKKHHYGIGGSLLGKGAGYLASKFIPGKIGGVRIGDVIGGGLGAAGSYLPFKKGGKAKRYASGGMADGGVPGVDYTARRGGHAKKHHLIHHEEHEYHSKKGKKHHYGIGGALFGGAVSPLLRKIPHVGNMLSYAAPIAGGFLPFKKGGKVSRRASGGDVYEREMVGEKPTRRQHHYDYEAQMVGERPVHGEKFAVGGVGKIRHKEMTRHGSPRRATKARYK